MSAAPSASSSAATGATAKNPLRDLLPTTATVSSVSAAATNAFSNLQPSTVSLIFAAVGVITVAVALTIQIFTLNNGSAGQLQVDSGLNVTLWSTLTGVMLFAVGFSVWLLLSKLDMKSKFLVVFLLAASSYILSNIAILMSSLQVTVASV
jgi:hypothetical protein